MRQEGARRVVRVHGAVVGVQLGGNSIGLKNWPKKSLRSQIEKDTCINCFKSYPARLKNGQKMAQKIAVFFYAIKLPPWCEETDGMLDEEADDP